VIVVDASFIGDYILNAAERPDIAGVIAGQDFLAAPTLIEYEVGSLLRRLHLLGKLSDEAARFALDSFYKLRLDLHAGQTLWNRAWELRNNITFYDATYVALAETLALPLYTRDRKLGTAAGHAAIIVVFP
jgi:predicted nucleic acid-binding protein